MVAKVDNTQIFDDKRITTSMPILLWTSTHGKTLPNRISEVDCKKIKPEIARNSGKKILGMVVM